MAAKKKQSKTTRKSPARKARPAGKASAKSARGGAGSGAAAAGAGPRVFTREEALRTGRISPVPGHTRSSAQLQAELDAMPRDFVRTSLPPSLLDREAEEMGRCKGDVPAFQAAGINITAGHFQLVADLRALLPVTRGTSEDAQAARGGFDLLEDDRALKLRGQAKSLANILELSGMDPGAASLGRASGNLRVLDAARAVVARCTPLLPALTPQRKARELLDGMKTAIGEMQSLRDSQAVEEGTGSLSSERVHRIKRLLLDAMRYVGKAGEVAFEGDSTREAAYRLQHVNAYRKQSGKKGEPGTAPGDVDGGQG